MVLEVIEPTISSEKYDFGSAEIPYFDKSNFLSWNSTKMIAHPTLPSRGATCFGVMKASGDILIRDFDDLKPSLVGVQTPGYGGADRTST
jgi:hypothetical protein